MISPASRATAAASIIFSIKLIYFNEVDRGCHFDAWQEPAMFATEVRAAFRSLRWSRVAQLRAARPRRAARHVVLMDL